MTRAAIVLFGIGRWRSPTLVRLDSSSEEGPSPRTGVERSVTRRHPSPTAGVGHFGHGGDAG